MLIKAITVNRVANLEAGCCQEAIDHFGMPGQSHEDELKYMVDTDDLEETVRWGWTKEHTKKATQ